MESCLERSKLSQESRKLMSFDDAILLISAAALLIGLTAAFLALWLGRRQWSALQWRELFRRQPIVYDGVPIDISPLQPRLRLVRADYEAALHLRPHPRSHSHSLLEAARQSILRLPYFQEHESDNQVSCTNEPGQGVWR